MMKVNRVAHDQSGTSDKVYIVKCVPASGGFDVVATWGGRGKNPQSQTKAQGLTESSADSKAADVFWSKTKKRYVDIESSSYDGPLTMNNSWLKPHLEEDKNTPSPFVPEPAPPEAIPEPLPTTKDFEVECLNAIGLDDRFDEGVTYMAEPHTDADMLWVWDINAEKTECFRERFQVVA